MEQVENGEKDNDSCHSSIHKNGEYEVRYMLEFSNNNLLLIYHIFDNLITIINFQHPKILDYSIKSKNCVKIERKKIFISPILLTFDNLELKTKMVSKFDRRASFLQKLIERIFIIVKSN